MARTQQTTGACKDCADGANPAQSFPVNPKLTAQLTECLRSIVRAFTAHAEDIEIEANELESSITLHLRVHVADHPKVLGKNARHLRALQTLFGCMGEGRIVRITLLNPLKGEPEGHVPFLENYEWDSTPTERLLAGLLHMLPWHAERIATKSHKLSTTFIVTRGAPKHRFAPNVASPVLEAMATLLEAIGKKEGRLIYIDFVR